MRRRSSWSSYRGWKPYVPVARRRAMAEKLVKNLRKKGQEVEPVLIEGRRIAASFWGAAWCDNLESYSDFSNRLPRGRTYTRNGSILDLRIAGGRIEALVSGSSIYQVAITVKSVRKKLWDELVAVCSSEIASVIELLEGRISKEVMGRLSNMESGLFPRPREFGFECSCPDWARMCKHVAATLYGVGARLDHRPELLFELREVDPLDLVSAAARGGRLADTAAEIDGEVLDTENLSELFGIDLDTGAASAAGDGRVAAPSASGPREKEEATPPRTVKRRVAGKKKSRPAGRVERAAGKPRAPVPHRRVAKKGATRPGKTPRSVSAKITIRKGSKVTPATLIELGIPRSTFQNWPGMGILDRTDRRGVYRATSRTKAFVVRALERGQGDRGQGLR